MNTPGNYSSTSKPTFICTRSRETENSSTTEKAHKKDNVPQ